MILLKSSAILTYKFTDNEDQQGYKLEIFLTTLAVTKMFPEKHEKPVATKFKLYETLFIDVMPVRRLKSYRAE